MARLVTEVEDWEEEERIDTLRLEAFKSGLPSDKLLYYMAVSSYFNNRYYRRMDAERFINHEPMVGLRDKLD